MIAIQWLIFTLHNNNITHNIETVTILMTRSCALHQIKKLLWTNYKRIENVRRRKYIEVGGEYDIINIIVIVMIWEDHVWKTSRSKYLMINTLCGKGKRWSFILRITGEILWRHVYLSCQKNIQECGKNNKKENNKTVTIPKIKENIRGTNHTKPSTNHDWQC